MAARIHQLLAIMTPLNTETDTVLARLGQIAATEDLFKGLETTSELVDQPSDPNARTRRATPKKVTKVRFTTKSVLEEAEKLFTRKWNAALTLDTAQGEATANLSVDGELILEDVPVRHLVYLEGELTKLTAIVSALPVLDGAQDWTQENTEPGQWRTVRPREGTRSDKVMFNWHKGNGTPTIKEDVEIMTRDEVVETTETVNFSGALPADRKALLLDRLSTLKIAVKMAREEANSAQVTQLEEGAALFGWLTRP
jgi:hypothetical protein